MSKSTKDPVVIEKWAKDRKGTPAKVEGTQDLIRIRFDPMEENLEDITWAQFFKIFKQSKLIFLYSDSPESRFNKFIQKQNE